MAEVRVFTGSHLSDRQARIDEVLRQHWGHAVFLLPSHRLVQSRRDMFIESADIPGVIGAPFKTFDQLASDIIEREGFCADTLSDFQRAMLVQEVLEDLRKAGTLGAFEAACATPGFAAHALRIITQLKQAGVEHDRFAEIVEGREHASEFDSIVSDVYAGYQRAVIETGVYDRVGVIWQAEMLAREASPKALAEIDVMLLDEFDDFTPSELRLIDALRAHVSEIVFGFAFNVENASQEDLYALPRATSRRVCKAFGVEFPVPSDESEPPTYSAFIAQHLFWRDLPPPPQSDCNFALIEYRDAWNEIEATARTIKTLLLDGVAPDAIAILHRNISDAALTVRCVFTECGIPLTLDAVGPLRDSSLATFLVEAIEAVDSWERDRIGGVLTSPWFARAAAEQFEPGATFLLARAAGVIEGHRDWSHGLESLHKRLTSGKIETRLADRFDDPVNTCNALRETVERLQELTAQFPARAPEPEYVNALIRLLDALRLDEVLLELPTEIAATEERALECMHELFRQWQAWCMGRTPGTPITRIEFIARLRRALQDTPRPMPRANGGVWCASMDNARHLQFAHVFLISMNEGTVPRPATVNAIYGRADVDALAKQGIELDSHERHTEREMLLLHRCMSTATERLTVSWHAVDATGKSRASSPFIEDIKSIVPGGLSVEPGDAAYAASERAASPRDLAASTPYIDAANGVLKEEYVGRIAAGAGIEGARYDTSPFGAYDGIVSEPNVLQALAQRFGEAHTFSVNQLEAYAACPFRFLMDRILTVPEDLPPEAAIDARERGDALHRILRAVYERYAGMSTAEIPKEDLLTTLNECIEVVFQPLLQYGSPHMRTLWNIERVRAHTLLKRHMQRAAAKDDTHWKPQDFEVAFGRVKPADDEASTRLDAFVMDTTAGPIRFSGKIDRIDRADDAVRIVDYKTTLHIAKKDVDSAESLQLPVYALAWDASHADAPCREASFVEIGSHKTVNAFRMDDDWDELAKATRARVGKLVQAIRDGRFPPDATRAGGCYGCAARRACRYEEARIERKPTADA